jgi:hypothetical protein
MSCAVAADTKVETPEGPLPIRSLANTPTAVMTRTDDGQIRFAMVGGMEKAGPEPVIRITLDNGLTFRVGHEQTLLCRGMQEKRAADVAAGDELEAAFAYRTDDGRDAASTAALAVRQVEPGGEAEVYRFRVNRTGRFVLSCGVLAKADGT